MYYNHNHGDVLAELYKHMIFLYSYIHSFPSNYMQKINLNANYT